ncbi:MAG: hypothetical protein RBT49_10785 [Bacteroidales bacterium]|nr:hypothetical protein [Bacteroidales bacterium]
MKNLYPIYFLIIFMLVSCTKQKISESDRPVAKVYNSYLYMSDLEGIVPSQISKDDSIIIVRNYINNWIKKQLMVRKAEINLSDESKNIQKEIEDYKSSLLIFRYKQELIKQKIDTVVTDSEVRNYYNQFSGNFILNQNILKASIIKISNQTTDIQKVRQWFKSDDPDNKLELDEYCYQYATKYHSFNDEWINFNDLIKEVPLDAANEDQILKYQKFIEISDSAFYYFVKINESALKSTVQPIDYAELKIKSIILNKRKFTFLDEIETNIYNDALDRNEFVIY